MSIALLALAAAPSLVIERLDWAAAGMDQSFVSDLATIDPRDEAALADDRNQQIVAHFGRSDLLAHHSSVHKRRACRAGDETALSMDALLERAAATRIVMLNEDHTAPWHRLTTAALLEPLAALGYRYFGAETFSRTARDGSSDPIERRGDEAFVRRADGFYFEPSFGRLVESARANGYTLVAYEQVHDRDAHANRSPLERVVARETAQAEALADIFARDPDARIVVHAGHSHISEEPLWWDDDTDVEWMAMRLAALTGIDPLTIEQTLCTAPADNEPRILSVPAEARSDVGTDVVIETAPPTDYRPRREGAIPFRVSDGWRSGPGWTIVELMRADHPDDAIPVDWLAVHASDDLADVPMLSAPPGRYRVRLRPLGAPSGD